MAGSITLGANQYGKASCRLVRVTRDGDRHDLIDLNVNTTVAGEFTATHLTGDNRDVFPTDSQKNAVYALAREQGIDQIESFGLSVAKHLLASSSAIQRARVHLEQYAWRRVGEHSFISAGDGVRTATVTATGDEAWVVGGLHEVSLLNTTGSQFWGFPRDRFTTLAETRDRVLATALDARWRFGRVDVDWGRAYEQIRGCLIDAFTQTPSLSLQQTLYAMGAAVLGAVSDVEEVRLSLPNKHHILVDLAPFGLDNPNEIYLASDQPYGLIEATVLREGGAAPGLAWSLERAWSS